MILTRNWGDVILYPARPMVKRVPTSKLRPQKLCSNPLSKDEGGAKRAWSQSTVDGLNEVEEW